MVSPPPAPRRFTTDLDPLFQRLRLQSQFHFSRLRVISLHLQLHSENIFGLAGNCTLYRLSTLNSDFSQCSRVVRNSSYVYIYMYVYAIM